MGPLAFRNFVLLWSCSVVTVAVLLAVFGVRMIARGERRNGWLIPSQRQPRIREPEPCQCIACGTKADVS